MKKYLPVLFLFFYHLNICSAQKEGYVWCFGDSAGIDFNDLNNPKPIRSNCRDYETSSSVSGPNGNLKLYASPDGGTWWEKVWDGNNKLVVDNINIGYSNTQGSLILPTPYDTSQYYLFHIGDPLGTTANGLHYSIINSNTSSVIKKNVFLFDTCSEKLQAVRHANGRDWWVIVTSWTNPFNFYKYLLTPFGIQGPIIQKTNYSYWTGQGQMVISEQGDKLALVSPFGVLILYYFNRCTGELTNSIDMSDYSAISNDIIANYGCSFSPDGNLLYVSNIVTTFALSKLYQYNLNASNIKTSRQLIWSFNDTINYMMGQHKLAPDGKIYIATPYPDLYPYTDGKYYFQNHYLSVINNPNVIGIGCNFQSHSFYLGGKKVWYALPNIPNYQLGMWWDGAPCDSLTGTTDQKNNEDDLIVFPNPCRGQLQVNSRLSVDADLEIYTIMGQKINSYAIREKQTILRLEESSGIYFYQIRIAGNLIKADKLIIVN